jgi:uncharacterized membrane protein YphA (DoxX/SURF4 family)
MASTIERSGGRVGVRSDRGINAALWVVQIVLAAIFAGAGFAKAATPLPELAQSLPYTADLPGVLVRFIGVSEAAAALGLILPALSRVAPVLTPAAAIGLNIVMWLATVFHLFRGEWSAMPMTIVLGTLAAFVAWGRLKRVPIASR